MSNRDETKDRMTLAESDQVLQSGFWLKYIARIQKIRDRESRLCETKTDDIRFNQGKIQVIDEILALPDEIKQLLARVWTGNV